MRLPLSLGKRGGMVGIGNTQNITQSSIAPCLKAGYTASFLNLMRMWCRFAQPPANVYNPFGVNARSQHLAAPTHSVH